MNERLRALREELGLTQQEFADRLKIKRGTIANYEIGRNAPIDAVIALICREFKVNEIWLRTGDGGKDNMFTKINEDDRYALNLGKLSNEQNQFVRNAINYLAESAPEKLKIIEECMKAFLGMN